MIDRNFNSEHPFGSARWADKDDLWAADLLGKKGLPFGYYGSTQIRVDSDAPVLVIAGSGSGKTRDILAQMLCTLNRKPMLITDPRGELYRISVLTLAAQGIHAYSFNLMGEGSGIPHHGCNPLDILTPDSPTLVADATFIANELLPKPKGKSEPYFIDRARDYLQDIIIARVEQMGGTSLPDLYRVIGMIESDQEGWEAQLEVMLNSGFASIRKTAAEMYTKSQNAAKEMSGILGEMYNAFTALKSPQVQAALEGGFSLRELADGVKPTRVYLNIPAEYLKIYAPIMRVMFEVTMLYKGRYPSSPRITLIADEMSQMGRAEGLLRAMTYGRGQGVRLIAVFQDIGQIEANYGRESVVTLLGSAETKVWFGVRDFSTAQLCSNMLGQETLEVDDARYQEEARRYRRQAMRAMLDGGDVLDSAFEYNHYSEAAKRKNKQARALMTPAEILAMPSDRAILMVSGRDVPPVYIHKYPYYSRKARKEMNGRYLPNPFHPPQDRVTYHTMFGKRVVRVIRGRVPSHLIQFPQFDLGYALKLEGHPF